MCKFKKSSFILILGVFVVLSTTASAGIYKCTNKKTGEIQYLDKSCSVELSEKKIRAVKDPKNGFIPAPLKKAYKAEVGSKKRENKVEGLQQKQAKIDEKYKDYRLDLSNKQKKMMYEAEQAMKKREEESKEQDILGNSGSVTPEKLEELKRDIALNQEEDKA